MDGKNIGKISELVDLAKSVDLPGKTAQKVLETTAFKEALDLDWSRAHKMGVTGVPTFVINQQAIVGAQAYEALEQFMKVNNVKNRDPNR